MDLAELKQRLGINEADTSMDTKLQFALEDAIDFVTRSCNQTFDVIPNTAKRVIVKFVQYELLDNTGVTNESIGGMSQAFESSKDRNDTLLRELSSAGLRRIRFIPLQ